MVRAILETPLFCLVWLDLALSLASPPRRVAMSSQMQLYKGSGIEDQRTHASVAMVPRACVNVTIWCMQPWPHQVRQVIASTLQLNRPLHNPIIAHFPVLVVQRVVLAGRIPEQTAAPQVLWQANASDSWSSGAYGSPEKPLTGTFTHNAAEECSRSGLLLLLALHQLQKGCNTHLWIVLKCYMTCVCSCRVYAYCKFAVQRQKMLSTRQKQGRHLPLSKMQHANGTSQYGSRLVWNIIQMPSPKPTISRPNVDLYLRVSISRTTITLFIWHPKNPMCYLQLSWLLQRPIVHKHCSHIQRCHAQAFACLYELRVSLCHAKLLICACHYGGSNMCLMRCRTQWNSPTASLMSLMHAAINLETVLLEVTVPSLVEGIGRIETKTAGHNKDGVMMAARRLGWMRYAHISTNWLGSALVAHLLHQSTKCDITSCKSSSGSNDILCRTETFDRLTH